MAELVDAHGLEPCGAILAGSIPVLGTNSETVQKRARFLVIFCCSIGTNCLFDLVKV